MIRFVFLVFFASIQVCHVNAQLKQGRESDFIKHKSASKTQSAPETKSAPIPQDFSDELKNFVNEQKKEGQSLKVNQKAKNNRRKNKVSDVFSNSKSKTQSTEESESGLAE